MGRSGTEAPPKPRTDGHKCGEWIEQMIGTMGRAMGKTYCFGNEAAKAEFMKDPAGNLATAKENMSKKM